MIVPMGYRLIDLDCVDQALVLVITGIGGGVPLGCGGGAVVSTKDLLSRTHIWDSYPRLRSETYEISNRLIKLNKEY